ncbi:hypothetical protein [Sphingomonas beigongshangi]|uniref:hypothetical protein n=1 Tax=Sphingomonas beigongshangi TaxID=2782540 RepID=UPI00193C5E2A|nr:hypothetical protein [Sphingomonas beigongshangi]
MTASVYRDVQIAQGHKVRVRRSRVQTERPGYVRVEKAHRPPFEITAAAWEAAAPVPYFPGDRPLKVSRAAEEKGV